MMKIIADHVKPGSLFIIAILAVCAALIHRDAMAIVIRHDIDPKKYEAEASEFPFLFAIYKDKNGFNDCLATLVAPQWAVTAEHCTKDAPLLAGLKNGGYPVTIAGKDYVVDRAVRHEGDIDLALLHLSAPVEGVGPLPLYRHEDEQGQTVFIPGWGGIGDGLNGLAPTEGAFRVAENRVDVAENQWLIWRFDDPRSALKEALALEGISGPGDSGGPALIMTPGGWAIAGVSSSQVTFARPEGLYGAEEYFTRISTFFDWIQNIITSP